MTDDLLARARQACDRAPEGPWEFDDGVVWRIAVRAVPDPRDETGQTPMPEYRQEKVCDTDPETAEFIAAARTLIPELIDALTDARDVNMMLRDSIKKLRAENERLRAQLDAVPSAIRAYAGGELDGYSYHGDGSAIEALRRISRHAENIRDYAATRQETTDEQ